MLQPRATVSTNPRLSTLQYHAGIPGILPSVTDLSQHSGIQAGLLKELDGHLAGHNSNIISVGLAEELAVDSLLVGGQVEVGRPCRRKSRKLASSNWVYLLGLQLIRLIDAFLPASTEMSEAMIASASCPVSLGVSRSRSPAPSVSRRLLRLAVQGEGRRGEISCGQINRSNISGVLQITRQKKLVMERSPRRRVFGLFFVLFLSFAPGWLAGHSGGGGPANPPCKLVRVESTLSAAGWKTLKCAKVRRSASGLQLLPASLAAHVLKWLIGHERRPGGNFGAAQEWSSLQQPAIEVLETPPDRVVNACCPVLGQAALSKRRILLSGWVSNRRPMI